MFYVVKLSRDSNGSWLVDVPALPHVHTFGDTKAEALTRAMDAILTGIEMLVGDKANVPAPRSSRPRGESVRISALVAAKIELHNAMLAEHVGKAKLARALNVHLPQVDRIVDVCHAPKLEQVERALEVVGRRLVIATSAA